MKFWNKLFLNGVKKFPYGSISIEWPNGITNKIDADKYGPHAHLKIADNNVIKEIIHGGSVKFAELYMDKRISSKNLTSLMHYCALNNDQAEETFKISFLKYLHNKFLHFKNRNTKIQAKKNISYHYDLGNQFYKYWLDKSMTYSSAIFSNQYDKLELAQKNKYKKLAELSNIKNGDTILEIGCGWGGFSEFLGNNYNCSYRYNVSINDGYRVKGEDNAFQEGKTFWLSGYIGRGRERNGPFNSYIYGNYIYVGSEITPKIAVDKNSKGVFVANNIFYFENDPLMVLGDQYKPDPGGKLEIENVFFKNNLFLKDHWPKDVLIQPDDNFYSDAFYKSFLDNAGLLEENNIFPTNHTYTYPYPKYFEEIKIDYINGDSKGLWKGF